ncbi:MAG: BON domain-containing protein [Tannerellaceae bacterium]|nr:BON domain-containing protein [Tannerellaceae bacterium]
MKKRFAIYLCGLLTILSLYACGADDQKLQNEVNATLTASYPGVIGSVKHGVATLSGHVTSENARIMAEQDVKDIKHIKSVVNKIEYQPAPASTPSTSIHVNSDNVINQTISDGLRSAGYNNITVEVMNGEVTLSGNVKQADLQRVMQIANEAQPRKVNNRLNIE